jgi:CRP-like cAMP-binding protein
MSASWIELDLSDSEPAPSPLSLDAHADLDAAARAYEALLPDDARRWVENLAANPDEAQRRTGAEVCRRARAFGPAAQLFEALRDYAQAADLYELAGDFSAAASCHQRAGNLVQAGASFERAGRVERALLFYQQAHAWAPMAECLARQERFPEAAQIYQRLGNLHAEVEMLRKVPELDPNWLAATRRLATLLEQHNQHKAALQLLTIAARRSEAARADKVLVEQVASLLEKLGRAEDAAQVRQRIEARTNPSPATSTAPTVTPARPPSSRPGDEPVLVGQVEVEGEGMGELLRPSSSAYGHLKAIPIFSRLALEDLRDLYRIAQEVTFAQGAVLIEQGRASVGLMVLWEGAVEVFAMGATGGKLLNRLEAGAYVGEISLMRDEPTTARVVAASPVRVLLLSRDTFKHYLDTHPNAALRIYEVFTSNLAERVKVLSSNVA